MPVSLAPYPTPPAPYTPPPANGAEPTGMFWMSKPFTLSSWSNLCVLRCVQCSDNSSTTWNRNGSIGLRRLSYIAHVHPWSYKRSMFLLSYCKFSHGRVSDYYQSLSLKK